MERKQTPPKTKMPSRKPPLPPKPHEESPRDYREAPVYREHDDFREWLMRDSR